MNSTEDKNLIPNQNNEGDLNGENINSENINTEQNIIAEKSIQSENYYKFGWSGYSEITNGRFAMLGFLAIILIEVFSKKSFLNWAGIF